MFVWYPLMTLAVNLFAAYRSDNRLNWCVVDFISVLILHWELVCWWIDYSVHSLLLHWLSMTSHIYLYLFAIYCDVRALANKPSTKLIPFNMDRHKIFWNCFIKGRFFGSSETVAPLNKHSESIASNTKSPTRGIFNQNSSSITKENFDL
jgi:hypothetical protein